MANKALLRHLYQTALEASLPKHFIPQFCRLESKTLYIQEDNYDLSQYKNIYIFGSGKAAFTMAQELEEILKEKIAGGLIVTYAQKEKLRSIEICESSHPVLTQKSVECAKKLKAAMSRCSQNDFYIYLLSGGSSSFVELPKETLSLEDMQDCTRIMLANSLDITKINTVRKQLSQIKGGKLANFTQAKGIALVLSDVIGDDLQTIGSAPLYPDDSTCKDAKTILKQSGLLEKMPRSIQMLLHDCTQATPLHNEIKHYILASNALALQAACKEAQRKGLHTLCVQEPMQGDVTQMHKRIIDTLEKFPNYCIIFGGECTVEVTHTGQGGRNQHLALLMLQHICQYNKPFSFLSAGTDGIDGNSPAAGAVVTLNECTRLSTQMIDDALKRFDSYNFFLQNKNDLIVTGATGTNVIDIAIATNDQRQYKGE
jgi:glycerate 2-kinase